MVTLSVSSIFGIILGHIFLAGNHMRYEFVTTNQWTLSELFREVFPALKLYCWASPLEILIGKSEKGLGIASQTLVKRPTNYLCKSWNTTGLPYPGIYLQATLPELHEAILTSLAGIFSHLGKADFSWPLCSCLCYGRFWSEATRILPATFTEHGSLLQSPALAARGLCCSEAYLLVSFSVPLGTIPRHTNPRLLSCLHVFKQD